MDKGRKRAYVEDLEEAGNDRVGTGRWVGIDRCRAERADQAIVEPDFGSTSEAIEEGSATVGVDLVAVVFLVGGRGHCESLVARWLRRCHEVECRVAAYDR